MPPTLYMPWKPDIIARPLARSTITACTFITTSSTPMLAPNTATGPTPTQRSRRSGRGGWRCGSALSMLGERQRALADYDTAITLEPGHPINHVSRAMVLSEMGDRSGALLSLRKALALAPGFPPALEQLEKIQGKKQTSR